MSESSPTTPTHPEAAIDLTEAAAKAILAKAAKEGREGHPLRVKIKGGGCSGVTYVMSFDDPAPQENDHVKEGYGATVIIDPRSIVFLKGSTLDYKADLMQQRFVWTNPNAKSSCGCGESFSI